MHIAPKYHPTADRIVPGATVALRNDRAGDPHEVRVIGQVDATGDRDGYRWALVSWPAEDTPTARTDERGRRAQGFSLDALMLVEDQPAEPARQLTAAARKAGLDVTVTGRRIDLAAGDGHRVTVQADRLGRLVTARRTDPALPHPLTMPAADLLPRLLAWVERHAAGPRLQLVD